MLNDVLSIAEARGWFDFSRPFEKSIHLSRGASLWMILSREGRPEVFLKFSDLVSLETEAKRCMVAGEQFPDSAPRFIGYGCRGAVHVLATQALDFTQCTLDSACRQREWAAICEGLVGFFQCGRESRVHAGMRPLGPDRGRWLDDLHKHFSQVGLGDMTSSVDGLLTEACSTLPKVAQHCDLVVNNLGLDRGNRLVIFDWEDYGAVDLPGLDLFTLEFSLDLALDFGSPRRSSLKTSLGFANCVVAAGLEVRIYERLRVVYAILFRYIKRHYGADVRQRIEKVIRQLLK